MLDRTTPSDGQTKGPDDTRIQTGHAPDHHAEPAPTMSPPKPGGLRRFGRMLSMRMSSSLSRRIIVLNLAGLVVLLLGYLTFNQFRAGLIEARVQSLLTQSEIIAGAISASATVEPDGITFDPDKLLQLQTGENLGLLEEGQGGLEFSINPEKVAPVLRRLVQPTNTRARVYDRDGMIVVDSSHLYSRGDIARLDLPPPNAAKSGSDNRGGGSSGERTIIERTWNLLRGRFGRTEMPMTEDLSPVNGKSLPEVTSALNGKSASVVRVNQRGQTIVSVAVPIQRAQNVRGALLLSTQGGDIDAIIASERFAIVEIFLIAAAVMLVLSFLLAGTIAEPMRKLAEAAERVRRGTRARVEIPDFTNRSDEIGLLSGSLRDMTKALYNRIEAIESFAADVAHELKNPLTSLRSAVETLPLAKKPEARDRLLSVIQHDVKRLDRLISDISDASRLDAELARVDAEPVDLAKIVSTVITAANEVRRPDQSEITASLPQNKLARDRCRVIGHDSRLGQVLVNLIDNARSFAQPDGNVQVELERVGDEVEFSVEDDGPGIPDHALERIFERFYTDRPQQGFGQNSGLGLSISRQIVAAHRGRIWAENILIKDRHGHEHVAGARFIVRLPAAPD